MRLFAGFWEEKKAGSTRRKVNRIEKKATSGNEPEGGFLDIIELPDYSSSYRHSPLVAMTFLYQSKDFLR